MAERLGLALENERLRRTDMRRQAWLEAEGNRVLRIPVSEITRSLADVIDTIDGVLLEQEQLGFGRKPGLSGQPRSS